MYFEVHSADYQKKICGIYTKMDRFRRLEKNSKL